jgi:acetyltransferase
MSAAALPAGGAEATHSTSSECHPLDAVFRPRAVAVIGATERPGSVGRALAENVIGGTFAGAIYPVHPTRHTVLGRKAWPTIGAVPGPVDLAVIATPAVTVPGVIAQCAEAGVRAAVIVSAGFRECGGAGAALERQVREAAGSGGSRVRIIGPNCLGVAVPPVGLNATFARHAARTGRVAFLSQSGALCTAVLDWSLRERVGFSAFVSVGSMLDVGWGDLIDYFGDDPQTKAIALYMESIDDARSFLSAAREVALAKPIVVIKAGRSAAAAKAALSHTGCMTGSDAVFDAALRRVGVLRVRSIAELFDMVEVLGAQPRPRGPKLTIVSNAGGPAVLATDALVAAGGELTELSAQTLASLDQVLPHHWSRGNPIDVLGDAGPDRYALAVEAAASDPATDGLLVILTPQAMTEPAATAERVTATAQASGKTVLASWMGAEDVAAGRDVLHAAGIPTFDYPDQAATAFHSMWRYNSDLQGLYETISVPAAGEADEDRRRGHQIVADGRKRGRTLLSERDSKQLLQSYGIACAEAHVALTEADAARLADRIGYPVALKLHSETVTHKAKVGGVKLNLANRAAVRAAYHRIERDVATRAGPGHFLGVTVQPMVSGEGHELIVGSSVDPQFGPVLLFGMGGRLVEVVKDRALGLPPLNATLARRMMEQTRIYAALKGGGVNLDALEQLLVRFSHLVVDQPWVREIEINPLFAAPDQLLALDARAVLHGPDAAEHDLHKPAIRPYPAQYVWPWTLRDGTEVTIRPIRPDDEPLIVQFHRGLSDLTVHYRYGGVLKLGYRVSHERLLRSCFTDYDRQIALVVDRADPASGRHEILGVARLIKEHGVNEADSRSSLPTDGRAGAWERGCSNCSSRSPAAKASAGSPGTCSARITRC